MVISAVHDLKGGIALKTIRTNLMIVMLAMTLSVIILMNIVALGVINTTRKSTVMSTAKAMASQTSKSFNDTIEQYKTNLTQALKLAEFKTSDNYDHMITSLCTYFPNELEHGAVFSIYDNKYKLYGTSDSSKKDLVSQDDVLQAASGIDQYITELVTYSGEEGDSYYFSILYPVRNDHAELIFAMSIDFSQFMNILDSDATGEHGFGFFMQPGGLIILSSDEEHTLTGENPVTSGNKKYYKFGEEIQKVIDGTSQSGSFRYDGTAYVYGASDTGYFGCSLIYMMTAKDFRENSAVVAAMIIVMGIVIMAATAVVSLIYSRRISRPITSATERIKLLADGNLTAPVEVWKTGDELGVLTNSLDSTIASLRKYINIITTELSKISQGDLGGQMDDSFKGDFAEIKNSFNKILASLSETFGSINTAAEQVSSGAVQVSRSAQQVSQGSTQQASSIEELSVTLKNVSKQVERNADDSKNAYAIVHRNTDDIRSCNEDMTAMVEAINDISASSKEIAKILKVIDEISFQTNILALNAAVEAAREGSKGFGVVADEVRQLASRSAEAAKQTADLIEQSSAAVARGTEIARKTADSLENIVEGSEEIQTLVRNISQASEEQNDAINQINTVIGQIYSVVSANTSSSVSTASASEELSGQSLILKNMIARFKLKDE